MKDRIRQVMESMHMTQQVFANYIGTSAAGLSSIYNGRTQPSLTTVMAVKNKIPALNLEWLLFGVGQMFCDEKEGADVHNPEAGDQVIDFNETGTTPQDLFSQNTRTVSQRPASNIVRQDVKYVDKPQRHITEIRVFFDDNTYESFVPKK